MGKVLDLNAIRNKQLQQEQSKKEAREFISFLEELLEGQTAEYRKEVFMSILEQDEKRYFELTNPLIESQAFKETMKQINK